MKWFHNDKVSLGWAVAVELIIHALFASQAFLLGGFLGEITHVGAPVGSWMLAIFIFGAAFQAFVLGEYMREHVEAFEATAKGNGSYISNWMMIRWLVGGIEASSLLFRCYTVLTIEHDFVQAGIVFLFGTIALWYAFAQAKVIHASVNRPVEYDVNLARNQAGKAIVSEALDLIPRMSAAQKRRFYTGDLSAIEEVQESKMLREQEKIQVKEDKEARKRQKQLDKQEREEEKRERARQRKAGQQHDYSTGQNYTKKLLGGENEDDPPSPFLRAVPNQSQANRNGA